jgi:DNA-binding CsgD family transcriptional regulator
MAAILTPAQYECARLAATFVPRLEIARRLGLSDRTVNAHLRAAYKRLGVRRRRELAPRLLACEVRKQQRIGLHGFRRGDPVRIVGGRYVGRVGTWLKQANSHQALVTVGGGTLAITLRFIAAGEERRAA